MLYQYKHNLNQNQHKSTYSKISLCYVTNLLQTIYQSTSFPHKSPTHHPLSHQSKNVNIYMTTILKFDNNINFIVYLEPFENEKL